MRILDRTLLRVVISTAVALIAGATTLAWELRELNVIGEGTVTAGQSSCWDMAFLPGCTIKASGIAFDATGTAFGSGAFSVELRTSLGPAEPNADGGLCLIANRAAEVLISPREQYVTLTNVEATASPSIPSALCARSPAPRPRITTTARTASKAIEARAASLMQSGAEVSP